MKQIDSLHYQPVCPPLWPPRRALATAFSPRPTSRSTSAASTSWGQRNRPSERFFLVVAERAGAYRPPALAEQLQLQYDAALAASLADGNGEPVERAREVARVLLAASLGARR